MTSFQEMTFSELLSDAEVFVDGDWVESKDQDQNGDVRLIQLADIGDGFYIDKSSRFLNSETAKRLKCTYLKEGDILVARMPDPLGRACIFPKSEMPCVTVVDVCIIRPNQNKVDNRWLMHTINSPIMRQRINEYVTGTTRQRISRGNFSKLKISVPPLAEQRRIASILDQADVLRQKRQQAIEKLDQLLQATFIDMFGDPVSNPKGWDLYKLSDLGSISTGNTPSRDDADNFGNYLEWIKSDNLNNDEDYATTATEYLSEKGAKKGRVVPEGSILVTCIAGSFDCIGNLAMVDRKVSFNQQINSITPNDTVVLEFLYYLMKISKPIIQNASTNSMKGMISKSKFSEILLPIPSKEKQIQFVELFKKLYGLKVSHKLYSNNADSLFKSLQNQAFNGTL